MEENKQKKQSVISQISTPLVVFLVAVMVVNAGVLFFYNINRYIHVLYEISDSIARSLSNEMEHYRCLDFLIKYWEDNSENMELVYSDPVRVSELEKELDDRMNGVMTDVEYVSNEQARAMDPESQKLLAEVSYAHMARFFDLTKRTYKPLYLYSFSMEGDTVIFNVTGALENEKRFSQGGDLFEIGLRDTYVKGRYPILDEIVRTRKPATQMELSLKSGPDMNVVHVFRPVYSNGEMVDIVAVSMEWRTLIFGAIWLSGLVGIVSAVLFILVGVWIFYIIKRVVADPLRFENEIINEYKVNKNPETAMKTLAEIKSGNEIEELADSFSSMVTELDRYVDEIRTVTAEKERIGAELNIAAKIQADMLPSEFPPFPDRKEFDIFASMKPAKEVGGDFYDFFFTDEDHLAIVIADVTGKGVPAALFMVIAKTLIKNSAMPGGKDPAAIFEEVNNRLLESDKSELFVTVWMGILTISTGVMVCANAGHEYPSIKRKNGMFEIFKDKHTVPLSVMEDMTFKDYELVLEPGDRIFVYTDGVAEATNSEDELYGTDRMIEALNRDLKTDEADEPIRIVSRSLEEFVGSAPQFDDTTMLSLIYRGV